ncbi:MAG: sigma-70 family RNA polymerase sigma factor, partial [Verrucomicrobiota bacterium]
MGQEKEQDDIFTTTSWTLVFDAFGDNESTRSALEELCRSYWHPLYSFVRSKGHGPEDSKDLVQGFFAQILGKNF